MFSTNGIPRTVALAKTTANYVCIEPWSSLSARVDVIEDLETQEDLISLNAGETYKNTWTITILE